MIAYKLFRVRKDGTLGSLFINRKARIPIGVCLHAKTYVTKGFKVRMGWHCTAKPVAPHLSMKGRRWYKVFINSYSEDQRPKRQGGLWYLADYMEVLGPVWPSDNVNQSSQK